MAGQGAHRFKLGVGEVGLAAQHVHAVLHAQLCREACIPGWAKN